MPGLALIVWVLVFAAGLVGLALVRGCLIGTALTKATAFFSAHHL